MKTKKSLFITSMLLVLLAFFMVLGGCSLVYNNTKNGDSTNTNTSYNQGGNIVSYVSTDSKVYSTTVEVVNAVADTVVEISTESVSTSWGRQYITSGAGSGVIVGVSENIYYIITNNHVIEGVNEITVRTRSGVSFNGRLIATDDSADIAVVAIESTDELANTSITKITP